MYHKTPLLFLGGVFLLGDRVFKYLALTAWTDAHLLWHTFGWEPFLNKGIAFGIAVPRVFTILLTLPILAGIAFLLGQKPERLKTIPAVALFGLLLVFVGGLSNLFDRVAYGQTVDYFRFFTSIVNLADLYIVFGFAMFFWFGKKGK